MVVACSRDEEARPLDSELLMRLVRARLDGDVSEDDFNAIRHGLELARSDDQDGEGEDEGVDSEICALIIQTIDALAAKQARLEQMFAALGVDSLRCAIFPFAGRDDPQRIVRQRPPQRGSRRTCTPPVLGHQVIAAAVG